MEPVIDLLARNPWLIVLGSVASIISLVSLPLSFYFYVRSFRLRLPRYALRSTSVITGTKERFPTLKITFEGHEEDLQNLTVTKVAFWNQGEEAIRKADVSSPVTIHLKDGFKIIDASIIQNKGGNNEVTITTTANKKSIPISFKYLDKNEGTVIQVFHTGSSNDVSVDGTIIGAGKPIRLFLSPSGTSQKPPEFMTERTARFQSLFLVFAPLLIPALFLLAAISEVPQPGEKPKPIVIANLITVNLAGALLFFGFCTAIFSWPAAYFTWKKRIPNSLSTFLKDF